MLGVQACSAFIFDCNQCLLYACDLFEMATIIILIAHTYFHISSQYSTDSTYKYRSICVTCVYVCLMPGRSLESDDWFGFFILFLCFGFLFGFVVCSVCYCLSLFLFSLVYLFHIFSVVIVFSIHHKRAHTNNNTNNNTILCIRWSRLFNWNIEKYETMKAKPFTIVTYNIYLYVTFSEFYVVCVCDCGIILWAFLSCCYSN